MGSNTSNPQQPQQRRSRESGATPQDSGELNARQAEETGQGHPHGTDKGNKGGGDGSGVPPDQQADHS
ncbi:hypothetical protein [Streptomyces sp. NPDC001914]|uniref:hypothetical protein n=1 Tax=Streptomyces sp. NPDC001914 TaxID=3364623 RepID=UPI0036B26AEB